MKVLLKRDFYYNDSLYESREFGIDMPDELAPHLPKDAKVIKAEDYKEPEHKVETLQDFDHERAATDEAIVFKGKAKKK